MPLLTIAVIVEVIVPGRPWNPVMPLASMYPERPLIRELEARKTSDRFAGIGGTLFPNVQAIFGLEDARVLDALALDRYMGVLKVATEYDTTEYYPKLKDPDSRLLDFLNVRWVATEPGVTSQRLRVVYDGSDGRIFENSNVLPRFFAAAKVIVETEPERLAQRLREQSDWRTAIVEERVDAGGSAAVRIERLDSADFRLEVDAEQPSLIVSSQALWPGWRIETEHETLRPIRVNGAFLGFLAPRGNSMIRVRYFPTAIYAAFALSAATFAALLIAAFRMKHG